MLAVSGGLVFACLIVLVWVLFGLFCCYFVLVWGICYFGLGSECFAFCFGLVVDVCVSFVFVLILLFDYYLLVYLGCCALRCLDVLAVVFVGLLFNFALWLVMFLNCICYVYFVWLFYCLFILISLLLCAGVGLFCGFGLLLCFICVV